MDEKRKNGSPRRFQWGLFVIGFALGALLTLAVSAGGQADRVYVVESAPDTLWLTATHIIQDATGTAAAPVFEPTRDPALDAFMATATAIIAGATQTAQAGH